MSISMDEREQLRTDLVVKIERSADLLGGDKEAEYKRALVEINSLTSLSQIIPQLIILRIRQISDIETKFAHLIVAAEGIAKKIKAAQNPAELESVVGLLREGFKIPPALKKKKELIGFFVNYIKEQKGNIENARKERRQLDALKARYQGVDVA